MKICEKLLFTQNPSMAQFWYFRGWMYAQLPSQNITFYWWQILYQLVHVSVNQESINLTGQKVPALHPLNCNCLNHYLEPRLWWSGSRFRQRGGWLTQKRDGSAKCFLFELPPSQASPLRPGPASSLELSSLPRLSRALSCFEICGSFIRASPH